MKEKESGKAIEGKKSFGRNHERGNEDNENEQTDNNNSKFMWGKAKKSNIALMKAMQSEQRERKKIVAPFAYEYLSRPCRM